MLVPLGAGARLATPRTSQVTILIPYSPHTILAPRQFQQIGCSKSSISRASRSSGSGAGGGGVLALSVLGTGTCPCPCGRRSLHEHKASTAADYYPARFGAPSFSAPRVR